MMNNSKGDIGTRRRVRLSIPKLIKEVLLEDMKYFNLKMDKLCNMIVEEMGYSKLLKFHKKLRLEKKLIINFNLTQRNTKYFKDMVRLSKEDTEAEFLRSLLSTYANLHPFLREKLLYSSKFNKLEEAIKTKNQIRVEIEGKILEIEPLYFSRNEHTKYAVLNFKEKEGIYQYNFKEIEILKA